MQTHEESRLTTEELLQAVSALQLDLKENSGPLLAVSCSMQDLRVVRLNYQAAA
jgi:hypothetical protein